MSNFSFISKDAYAGSFYPSYVSGGGYLISSLAARLIISELSKLRFQLFKTLDDFSRAEDVLFTGTVQSFCSEHPRKSTKAFTIVRCPL